MKRNLFIVRRFRSRTGFTLVELLTVIAIIAILAAMLLPVLATVKKHALVMKAKTEISDLLTDIQAYDQAYGRFPVSHQAQAAAAGYARMTDHSPDFTYGGTFNGVLVGTQVSTGNVLSNNEVVSILMDYTNYPNSPTVATINTNHQSNPQQTKFLNAKMSGWDATQPGPPPGGVDNNLVYRDPWGNPYIVTVDLNYDDQTMDDVYRISGVSHNPASPSATAGYNGLVSAGTAAAPNSFQFHGKVMVWSAGPDGKIDRSGTVSAIQGVNKDNILSWQ